MSRNHTPPAQVQAGGMSRDHPLPAQHRLQSHADVLSDGCAPPGAASQEGDVHGEADVHVKAEWMSRNHTPPVQLQAGGNEL